MDHRARLRHFREYILYSIVSYTFILYNCHPHAFPEFFPYSQTEISVQEFEAGV